MVFSCRSLKKSFGEKVVLEDVSFLLEEGEKVAVVGVNGAGKTTLFKIIMGDVQQDEGEIAQKKGSVVGYLAQMTALCPEKTIEEEFLSVFDHLLSMEEELREIEKTMATLTGDELSKAMERYAHLNHTFEEQDGYAFRSRLRGVMKGLGFLETEFSLPICVLSGGQKTRVSLGKLLLGGTDVLLLDEPTNHLDIDSVAWLEDYLLKQTQKSVLVISHDRYFLDRITTKTIEIENGKAVVYNGNYSYFAYKKEIDRSIMLKQYMDQQKIIKKQEETIRLLKSFNREKSIKRAESREKMLAKMDRIQRPEAPTEKMRILLEPSITSGNDVLLVSNVSKSFDGQLLFSNANLNIKRGDITALIGPNGVGKTTLFHMIVNQETQTGVIQLGSNVKVGYYDQEHSLLHFDKTIFQEIADTYPRLKNVEIRNALAAFMFCGDDVFKPISTLSGGELGRVSLARLMLGQVNFLLLDEPTNHLDMFSKEILEECLRNYTGTVLYISHDRYFINNTAENIVELTKEGTTTYLGNYDDYLLRKSYLEKELGTQQVATLAPSPQKDDWKRKKEEQAEQRRLQTQMQKLEASIATIENEIALLEEEMQKEEVFTNHEKAQKVFEQKSNKEQQLMEFYEEWEAMQNGQVR